MESLNYQKLLGQMSKIFTSKSILFDILGINPRFNVCPLSSIHALHCVLLGKSLNLSEGSTGLVLEGSFLMGWSFLLEPHFLSIT